MTVVFRALTPAEAVSSHHLCGRCGITQRRFEIHACTPTARYLAAKSGGVVLDPSLNGQPIRRKKPLPALPAPPKLLKGPEKAKPKAKPAKTAKPVNTEAVNNSNVDTDRKAYMREYQRARRAAAKANEAA